MKHGTPEETSYSILPFLGGSGGNVEMLRADYREQNFSRHFHEEYAVGFIERGAMAFRYRGENLVAHGGTINLVVPGEAHDGHPAGTPDPLPGWTYRMFYLQPETLLLAASEILPSPNPPHFRKGVLHDAELGRMIRSTHMALESSETSTLAKDSLLLRMLVHWISRHADDRRDWPRLGREPQAVGKARDYLRENCEQDTSLAELSRLCGLSPFHLARVFEKSLGISPHAYLVQARVNRAKKLLPGNSRLADIAAECGFSDQSHMTRQFHRQFGITPGRYRKIVQNS